jgi:hypothetical protein
MDIIRRNPDAIYRIEKGKAIVFEPGSGQLYQLNQTATKFWTLCEGSSLESIVRRMNRLYGTEEKKLRKHLSELTTNLKKMGLLYDEKKEGRGYETLRLAADPRRTKRTR